MRYDRICVTGSQGGHMKKQLARIGEDHGIPLSMSGYTSFVEKKGMRGKNNRPL